MGSFGPREVRWDHGKLTCSPAQSSGRRRRRLPGGRRLDLFSGAAAQAAGDCCVAAVAPRSRVQEVKRRGVAALVALYVRIRVFSYPKRILMYPLRIRFI